jgi:hypothetical protein
MESPIKRFFMMCSGANLGVLSKGECEIEQNKYIGIGATILSTAVLACFSGGYALYTVFNSVVLSIFFGLLWGTIIFNLDRYIVSSLRKANLDNELTIKQRIAAKLGEVSKALPRLALAIFISIVITKPIELKLFGNEITTEFEDSKMANGAEIERKANVEFARIGDLEQQNQHLNDEIRDKENERHDLEQQKFAELEGWGGSHRPGAGPIHREKQHAFERATAELASLRNTDQPVIDRNDQEIKTLKAQREERIRKEKEKSEADPALLKRMEMLDQLKEKHSIIKWASNFIVLLFILLETAPIFVKLLSERGPYDEIVETMEHKVRTNEFQNRFELGDDVDTELSLHSNMRARQLAAELELSRRTMASLETLAGPEILEAQMEIAQVITAEWRRAELEKLRVITPAAPSSNGSKRTAGAPHIDPRHNGENETIGPEFIVNNAT